MDLLFVIASLLLFIISFGYLVTRLYGHDTKQRFPPGTFGWPIVGEALQFSKAYKKGLMEQFVRERTKKYGSPVFRTSLLGQKYVVFSGVAANKFVIKNENEFLSAWKPPNAYLLFPSYTVIPIEHDAKNFRKYLGILFRTDSIQKFITTLDAFSQSHLKTHWQEENEVKVYHLVRLFMFSLGCKISMSIKNPDQISKLFKDADIFAKGILAMPFNFPGTALHRSLRSAQVLRKEIGSIVKQREVELSQGVASPTQDLISHVLSLRSANGEAMSQVELIDKILMVLLGGLDTSAGVLTFTMKYLAENPHLYDEVLNEHMEIRKSMKPRTVLCGDDIQKMTRTWNFVNEVLRTHPTFPVTIREVEKDIYYDDFLIPKGWKICWTVGLTPKNCLSNPDDFDPSRFEDAELPVHAHIPFSIGIRMCPGKEYARLTILVFLHYVLTNFKWESVLRDEKVKYGLVAYLEKGYPVRLSAI